MQSVFINECKSCKISNQMISVLWFFFFFCNSPEGLQLYSKETLTHFPKVLETAFFIEQPE